MGENLGWGEKKRYERGGIKIDIHLSFQQAPNPPSFCHSGSVDRFPARLEKAVRKTMSMMLPRTDEGMREGKPR